MNPVIRSLAPKSIIGWLAFSIFIYSQFIMAPDYFLTIKSFFQTYSWSQKDGKLVSFNVDSSRQKNISVEYEFTVDSKKYNGNSIIRHDLKQWNSTPKDILTIQNIFDGNKIIKIKYNKLKPNNSYMVFRPNDFYYSVLSVIPFIILDVSYIFYFINTISSCVKR